MRSTPRPRRSRTADMKLVDDAVRAFGGEVQDFAERIVGVDPSTLRRWRNGTSRLNRFRRSQLRQYLTRRRRVPLVPSTSQGDTA